MEEELEEKFRDDWNRPGEIGRLEESRELVIRFESSRDKVHLGKLGEGRWTGEYIRVGLSIEDIGFETNGEVSDRARGRES